MLKFPLQYATLAALGHDELAKPGGPAANVDAGVPQTMMSTAGGIDVCERTPPGTLAT